MIANIEGIEMLLKKLSHEAMPQEKITYGRGA